jgi:hypothetical protein
MTDRNKVIGTLGDMLYQAARASVAKGAVYDPGDNISQDAEAAWRGIAEAIVGFVEQRVAEGREVEGGKG